jgi:predicted metal-dependent hydrolase
MLPDDLAVTPEWALATAQQLLDNDRPFHAHEVLEAAWKAAEPAERDLWQGLAQLAVGLTHALRGNAAGAVALLRRGTARLGGYHTASPHGIDTAGLISSGTALATRIQEHGLGGLAPADLRLRLTAKKPGQH